MAAPITKYLNKYVCRGFLAHLGLVDIPQRMLNIFLLYCNRFDAQRNILYRYLLAANVHIDLNTLLFGSQIYNIDTNRHVFNSLWNIHKTKMG
jgi:hypothetical protein